MGRYVAPGDFGMLVDLLYPLATNCLYSPAPRNHCRATVLSSHPNTDITGISSMVFFTLETRFVAMCAETSSKRGIVRSCLANRDLAATKPTLHQA